METNLIFRQLFDKETGTYTYVLADKETKEAVIIDSVKKHSELYLNLFKELDINLKYIIDTHIHADHITAAASLKEKTGAKIVLGEKTGIKEADILLKEGESLEFGEFKIKAIPTPGHTNGCTTYLVNNMLFTGDTLLYRSSGRVDFQEGSAEKLYESLQKLFKFDDETLVYPGHNYEGFTLSTIGEEKKFNKFIGGDISKEEFIVKVNSRGLPLPKYMDIAVPANTHLGKEEK